MLGRFLEVSLATDRPLAAWETFQQLRFAPALTGDIWSHEYGVVCCAGLSLGWHAGGHTGADEPLALCTVRPNVISLQRELQELDVDIESARLGPDIFNQLLLREPSGMAIKVLEARSFTQPADVPGRTLLGRFESLSLPVRELESTATFWSTLGYAAREISVPWIGIEIDGLPLAYHTSREYPGPLLIFQRDAQGLDLEPLLACGLARGRSLPSLSGGHHLLRSPGEIDLLLLA
ncbi:MAG: hypothetical protein ABI616_10030 [Pseudomonadota bacterium]